MKVELRMSRIIGESQNEQKVELRVSRYEQKVELRAS